jgi:ubiquinone/menaquinone biosynthesis C-methylase UbiE
MNHEYVRNMLPAIKFVVVAIAVLLLIRQCRKPAWYLGRLIVRGMNRSHAGLTTWGLSRVAIQKEFTILDVGCGGGQTIDTLATRASAGTVHGVDYSNASVAVARETNARWIEQGRVDIRLGSVSNLPFDSNTFDVVTAIETHYYWPDLPTDVKEILRVLKPGGGLVIIAEAYRGRPMDWLYRPVMRLLQATYYLSTAEHEQLLVDAGYSSVEVVEERSKGWICAVGRKRL